jgi:hypothetical protein
MLLPLLALAVWASPGPAEVLLVPAPPEDPIREAKLLRYSGRWFEAAALYRRYLADGPEAPRDAEARFWLADTLFQDQRWDEAALAFTDFLVRHPDQRLFGKQARLNRIQCWGIRQGQNPRATPGLLEALADALPEVRVSAALQLAKKGDTHAVPALQHGLALPEYSEACRLALSGMGVQPDPQALPAQGRFLVLKIKSKDHSDEVTVRIALGLARAVTSYMSEEQLAQLRKKGVDPRNLMDLALSAPKGSELFSVQDKESSIRLFVE